VRLAAVIVLTSAFLVAAIETASVAESHCCSVKFLSGNQPALSGFSAT
jgi:hypothetical protein